jgi:hypothetical protein
VYAAAYLRERRIVLEKGLLSEPTLLRFIFVHELFHFVWMRLGNPAREEYSCLIAHEIQRLARGELGESSLVKKTGLPKDSQRPIKAPVWRDYVCESFCDSASHLLTGALVHEGSKLGRRWTDLRRAWFEQMLRDGRGLAV